MQVTYIRNGHPRLLITPETELEIELLGELEGAEVTILGDSATLLGELVAHSLQIKLPAGQEPKGRSFWQKIFGK